MFDASNAWVLATYCGGVEQCSRRLMLLLFVRMFETSCLLGCNWLVGTGEHLLLFVWDSVFLRNHVYMLRNIDCRIPCGTQAPIKRSKL
jgi:hypothetical protein